MREREVPDGTGMLPHPYILLLLIVFLICSVFFDVSEYFCSTIPCLSTNTAKNIRIFIAAPEILSTTQPSHIAQTLVLLLIAFVPIICTKIGNHWKAFWLNASQSNSSHAKAECDSIAYNLTLLCIMLLIFESIIIWSAQTDIAIKKYGEYREAELQITKQQPDKLDSFRDQMSRVQNLSETNIILKDMYRILE